MPNQVAWRLVSPMLFLSAVLLLIGAFAARTVQTQQKRSSQAMAKEVESLIELENLYIESREVRYQINLFLRNQDSVSLRGSIEKINLLRVQLNNALAKQATVEEQGLVGRANRGFDAFSEMYWTALGMENQQLPQEDTKGFPKVSPEGLKEIARLTDEVLTTEVLEPLKQSITANQAAVNQTNADNLEAARQLMYGFLLLGICGGLAGVLMGLGVGRALSNSMVQLSVSIRDAAVKLSDVRGVITLTRHSDLQGLRTGVQRLAEDITHVVQQLQQRERELMQSERLGQLGQLAAGMAHELRNPLMPMKMLVESALESPNGAGLTGRPLEVMRQEIARLEDSIQSFLDFARPPNPVKTEQNLVKVIEDTLVLVRARAEKQDVSIEFVRQQDPIHCVVDKSQFCQLLLNLILNSLDALSDGGHIEVELGVFQRLPKVRGALEKKGSEPKPNVTSDGPAAGGKAALNWAQLRISDDGPGLAPEIVERIFEPFATTKETGMGLGLATCKRIVMAHEGSIEVRNRPQRGTEFLIQLPADS